MHRAVIVDVVRTPTGKRNGRLRGYHAVDLAAIPLRALIERNRIDPALVEDVIMGCVSQTGEQSLNVGRNAALAAGFPEDVVGTTVDRQCGSGQQAAHFAAQGVMAGAYEVAIAAGVESMSRVPMGSHRPAGSGPAVRAPHGGALRQQPGAPGNLGGDDRREVGVSPGSTSTGLPTTPTCVPPGPPAKDGSDRNRPGEVGANGAEELMTSDEGIRPSTSPEVLAGLPPVFKADGVVTAATRPRSRTAPLARVDHVGAEGEVSWGWHPRRTSGSSRWRAWIRSACSPDRSPPPHGSWKEPV